MDVATFAAAVDHTLLKPEATRAQVEQLCGEAAELRTASACVNGYWVPTVAAALSGTGVLTCGVVGFPLGAVSGQALAAEIAQAEADGAQEVDMVLPVGLLKGGDEAAVAEFLATAREAAGGVLKVILEAALLTDAEIVRACELSVEAGADFVKTSTGFNPAGGASVGTVALMRETVGPGLGVKASGGIRSLADATSMLDAGASRLGLSATVAIVAEIDAAT